MPQFKVLRRLDGDKLYEPGDVREMAAIDAKGLVASGALEPVGGKAKEAASEPAEGPEEPAKANGPAAVDEMAPAPRRGRPPAAR